MGPARRARGRNARTPLAAPPPNSSDPPRGGAAKPPPAGAPPSRAAAGRPAQARSGPGGRGDARIEAEAARLAAHPDGPVIAAGSTGSMPATAELIAAIAKLARSAVVLPGLDLELDAQSWELIGGRGDGDARVAPAV